MLYVYLNDICVVCTVVLSTESNAVADYTLNGTYLPSAGVGSEDVYGLFWSWTCCETSLGHQS